MSKKKRKTAQLKQRQKRQQKKREIKNKKNKASKPIMFPQPHLPHSYPLLQSFADIETPEGFRPISQSQAIIEYGEPLMDLTADSGPETLNAVFGLVALLWNLGIAQEQEDNPYVVHDTDVLTLTQDLLQMSKEDSKEFIENMLNRKRYLFPPEIQPQGTMHMFIRKGDMKI